MLLVTCYLLVAAALAQSPPLATLESRVAADPENLRVASDYRQAVIAAGVYDRAIKFFDTLANRPGAGPHRRASQRAARQEMSRK